MKIDAALLVHDLNQMPAVARFADDAGFDGIWTFETAHEPFLPLVLAAEHAPAELRASPFSEPTTVQPRRVLVLGLQYGSREASIVAAATASFCQKNQIISKLDSSLTLWRPHRR